MKKRNQSEYGRGFYSGICLFKNLFQEMQVEIRIFDLVRAFFDGDDTLIDFIEACCFLQKDRKTSASDLYLAFRQWYRANYDGIVPSQKKFGQMMVKCFKREKHGTFFYYDVGIQHQISSGKKE